MTSATFADHEDPPSRRKYYRRAPEDEERGLGKFGEDSEDEGDHSSSYDGPASSDSDDADFCEYLDWVREMEETLIEETEMEAAYLADKGM